MEWPRDRLLRILLTLAMLVAAGAWALLLRPHALGGPAAYVIVSGHSMEPRLETGDLVVLRQKQTYAVGDVIAYTIPRGQPGEGRFVIHRIVGGSPTAGYVTRGDNREREDLWRPKAEYILGSTWLSVPRAGHVLAAVRAPFGVALAAGLATFLFVSSERTKKTGSRRSRCPYALAHRIARRRRYWRSWLGVAFQPRHAAPVLRHPRRARGAAGVTDVERSYPASAPGDVEEDVY